VLGGSSDVTASARLRGRRLSEAEPLVERLSSFFQSPILPPSTVEQAVDRHGNVLDVGAPGSTRVGV